MADSSNSQICEGQYGVWVRAKMARAGKIEGRLGESGKELRTISDAQ